MKATTILARAWRALAPAVAARPAVRRPDARMDADRLALFLRHVALAPFALGVRARLIDECSRDSALRGPAAMEAQRVADVRRELARSGWWN